MYTSSNILSLSPSTVSSLKWFSFLTGDKCFMLEAVLTCVWMNCQKCGGRGEIWHGVTGLADCDVLCADSPGAWVKRWRRWGVRQRLNRRRCLITAWTTSLISTHSFQRWCWCLGTEEMCLPTHLKSHLLIICEKFVFILLSHRPTEPLKHNSRSRSTFLFSSNPDQAHLPVAF